MNEHRVTEAVQLSPGRYRAGCACGYSSGVYPNARAAERWASHHLAGTRGELFQRGQMPPATGGLDG